MAEDKECAECVALLGDRKDLVLGAARPNHMLVVDLDPGPTSSSPRHLNWTGSRLVFSVTSGSSAARLFGVSRQAVSKWAVKGGSFQLNVNLSSQFGRIN